MSDLRFGRKKAFMKILITGNRGFVGTETKRLLKQYHYLMGEVTHIDDIPEKKFNVLTHPAYEVIGFDIMDGCDVRDYPQLEKFIEENKPDRVLHLAAIARFSDADADPKLAFETNVMGTRNVSLVCQKFNIPLVYASTGSVYMPINQEPPITEEFKATGNSVYGCTKYAGELYVKEHTPHIILRYAHLYGREKRGHGLIGGFIQRIQRGLAPQLYGGNQSNDFTYIKDVARANLLALTASWDKWNQVYNVGTGDELSAKLAGEIICEAANYRGEIETLGIREVDASRFVYDTSKAEKMLGFKAEYSFEAGLKDMFSQEEK